MLVPTRKLKSTAKIKTELEQGLVCQAPGCCENLTIYEGAGSNIFCNTHQLNMRENGGLAKAGRIYTIHKEWCCTWCGYDPRKDARFDRLADPSKKLSAQSGTLICDHIVPQKKAKLLGWTDEKIHAADNIQTLCQICEKIKSAEDGDWDNNQNLIED